MKLDKRVLLMSSVLLVSPCTVIAAPMSVSPAIVPLSNGGQANIAVSNTDPNLFSVAGDRVIAINSLDGELTRQEQTANGGVVIATLNKKPFTFIVETERGLNFSIRAVPRAGVGRTIQLVSELTGTGDAAKAWEESTPYQSLLVELNRGVRTGIYGAKGAATLFDVLNTRAFFRSPSKQIADFAAGEIGEKEQLKASEQYSYGVDPVRDGTSVGKDMERVTLVSYSDIQTLPDLTCYITLPGPYPAVKLPLKYQTRPKVAQEFIARSIDTDAETHLSAVLAAREEEGRGIAELFTPDAETAEPAVTENKPVAETQTQTTPPVAPRSAENAAQPVPKVSSKAAAPAATSLTTANSATAAAVVAPVGGVEQELEEREEALPPGIDSQGELVDPDAYERWQAEHEANSQRTMQRREEVNINHGQSSHDDVEVGDTF